VISGDNAEIRLDQKIKLVISSCLLGEKVRYDGGLKPDHYLINTLGRHVEWTSVCPEVGCGLSVPREAMRLEGTPEAPRLVTRKTGIDYTAQVQKWASQEIRELKKSDLSGFIFKSKSPSCGISGLKVYGDAGEPVRRGTGIFSKMFMECFPLMPVGDEAGLQDPGLRENFIVRVLVYRRWQEYLSMDRSINGLVAFHTDHKLLLLAHSARHYSYLGRLVAEAKNRKPSELHREYISSLMDGLRLIATVRKNTNVLQHIAGYFRKKLSPQMKQELLRTIETYHKGLVPLLVPITTLRHYVEQFNDPHLMRQHYLDPHPIELMIRRRA
jgi:uncharacterized protein YbgA (DUF1722 family)/uncharacterized protein YbbK (DUF523 family)